MHLKRCPWAENSPLETYYHDNEWGNPLFDDRLLFEKLTLEAFQSGLSWYIILSKREGFRKAFDSFHPEIIASYDENKISQLMKNKDIVRNQRKINATINNAKAYISMNEGGQTLSDFFWRYVDGKTIINKWQDVSQVPSNTPLSVKIAKDLKKLGFQFVGPTTVYSLMQSAGLINDHLVYCHRWQQITDAANLL